MLKIILIIILNVFMYSNQIKIAAAANISYPLEELLQEFKKEFPNIKISTNTGPSGGFFAQIKHGANYDVFLSANMQFAKELEKSTPTKVYAKGQLMLFSPKKNVNINSLKTASCIAIANPKTAPYGKAALEFLNKTPNSNKIIKSTSIATTLSQTLKACEIGLIAASSKQELLKLGYSEKNMQIIDTRHYEPILQGAVLLSDKLDAKVFYDFLTSTKAKEIFKKYGYK